MALLHGLGLGLATALLLGPVFFTLIRNAMLKGYQAGIATAVGILVSDVVVLLLCYVVAAPYIEPILAHPLSYYVAALILFIVGLSFALKRIQDESQVIKSTSRFVHFGSILQGFLVNFANPFVFAIWIGFITVANEMNYTSNQITLYFVGILLGIFVTDTAKSLFAPSIKKWLNVQHLRWVYRILGLILMLFAIRLTLLQLI